MLLPSTFITYMSTLPPDAPMEGNLLAIGRPAREGIIPFVGDIVSAGVVATGDPDALFVITARTVDNLGAVGGPLGLLAGDLNAVLLVGGGAQEIDAPVRAAMDGVVGQHGAIGRQGCNAAGALFPAPILKRVGDAVLQSRHIQPEDTIRDAGARPGVGLAFADLVVNALLAIHVQITAVGRPGRPGSSLQDKLFTPAGRIGDVQVVLAAIPTGKGNFEGPPAGGSRGFSGADGGSRGSLLDDKRTGSSQLTAHVDFQLPVAATQWLIVVAQR